VASQVIGLVRQPWRLRSQSRARANSGSCSRIRPGDTAALGSESKDQSVKARATAAPLPWRLYRNDERRWLRSSPIPENQLRRRWLRTRVGCRPSPVTRWRMANFGTRSPRPASIVGPRAPRALPILRITPIRLPHTAATC